MKRKVPETMGAAFGLIEASLSGPWVAGDRYTICDPYLFTISEWLEGDGVDLSKLPKVLNHRRRMLERESVRAALVAEGRS
jgi:glutathione S-transferase